MASISNMGNCTSRAKDDDDQGQAVSGGRVFVSPLTFAVCHSILLFELLRLS
jgi:hypothetical protein